MAKPPAKNEGSARPPETEILDPIAEEIQRRVSSLVSKQQAAQVTSQMVSLFKEERFSGPIAHPNHLRAYEEIVPGSAERIIAMAEKGMEHNQKMDAEFLQANVNDTKMGRWFGFGALMALIVAALWTGLAGHTVLAGLFLGAGALGTVGVFVRGRGGS